MRVLISSVALLSLTGILGCEFNRDGRRCEPRIQVGGTCAFGLSAADEAPAREPGLFIPGDPSFPPSSTQDQGCEPNAGCESRTLTCQPLPGIGQPCLDGSSCAPPLVCDFSIFQCAQPSVDGEPCESRSCATGHRCVDRTCIASALFSPCSAHTECPAGHFCELAGTRSCLVQVTLGEVCAASAACAPPGVCSSEGRCVAPLERGDECVDGCGGGLFCTAGGSSTNDRFEDGVTVPSAGGLGGSGSRGR